MDIFLPNGEKKLQGGALILAAFMLALGNFIAVLDMTITNVAVPTIAGDLGITNSQGTWVITSYAVAEAISVPLTGWLANRFGSVRVFLVAMLMFGLFSLLCGLANSLPTLVGARILQGLAGGPMMPLSQTLLLRIFPREKAAAAMALWAMTTLVAPVAGPVSGGWICDNFHWSIAFLINVPIAIATVFVAWPLLKRYELPLIVKSIDFVGLILLIVWVGALQIMFDEGKQLDWFNSHEIVMLAWVAGIGFCAFMIWELTEEHPIVDLRIFRHRGYSASVFTLVLAFGAFFGINVLTPLWLQSFMGYTPTWSGKVTAWSGVLAVFFSPIVAALSSKFDPRKLVFIGVSWLGIITLIRAFGTTDMTYWNIAFPILIMGIGMPLFFVPLSQLALQSVNPEETESAAGLMAFLRTVSGAFATSLVTTFWDDEIKAIFAQMVASADKGGEFINNALNSGMHLPQAAAALSMQIQSQAVMIATNNMFMILALAIFIAACTIWLAPRPEKRSGPPPTAH
jgi:MFS transporter, DHA2 family, multidrug resistance protein